MFIAFALIQALEMEWETMSKYAILLKAEEDSSSKVVRLKSSALSQEDFEYAALLHEERTAELCEIVSSGNRSMLKTFFMSNDFVSFEFTGNPLSDHKTETLLVIPRIIDAAIKGGASVGDAYRIRHLAVLKVMEATGMMDIFMHLKDLIYDCCGLVVQAREDIDKPQLVRKVDTLIQENPGTHISSEMINEELGMNARYVRSRYRQLTGKTIDRAVTEHRILSARILLLNQTRSIADVAAGLGYQSLSHFYRDFTEVSGISPGKYRDKILGNR